MKITAITAQVKTPGRYSIFIDGKFAFGLSQAGLLSSGIRIGQEYSATQLEQLKDTAQVDKMYNKVLELVMRRPRSQWEIEDYLKRKKQEPELIGNVVARLSERGFVDDADFARRWVESRHLLKPTSTRKLTLELKQKRISDEIIRQVLSDDQTDEREVLRAEITKKRRQTRYQDDQKLIAYLARQGYRYDDIKTVLTEEK